MPVRFSSSRVWLRCVLALATSATLAAQSRPALPRADPATAFRATVLISAKKAPDDADVRKLLVRADEILFDKTGARLSVDRVTRIGAGQSLDLAQEYMEASSAPAVDGVIVFGDDEEVLRYGGYNAIFAMPRGGENRYPTSAIPTDVIYVAMIDAFHRYAVCGYDGAGQHVSATSRGGECRGQRGLTCVDNGNYWMCPDSTADLFADRDTFLGCAIVHELVHPFGDIGDNDHYGTPECTARTRMTRAEAGDRKRFQQNCGMCPDLFAKFKARAK